MRKCFSVVQWTAWFDEVDQRGLSVIEFCRRIGASQKSFYVWRGKPKRSVRSSPADRFALWLFKLAATQKQSSRAARSSALPIASIRSSLSCRHSLGTSVKPGWRSLHGGMILEAIAGLRKQVFGLCAAPIDWLC